jgi:hypothetical protein
MKKLLSLFSCVLCLAIVQTTVAQTTYTTAKGYAAYDHLNERSPCFIDKHGNICAVGYLVEHTVGREVADKINSSYKYTLIKVMKLPELAQWVLKSGLTLNECAMIQPSYTPPIPPTANHIEPSYGI